ncbi:MAG: sensor histidine kinase [Desulfobulbaceae bacterium]|nr:MAG: sensor histidine kinase [Desulfobulbaceae bacterium]
MTADKHLLHVAGQYLYENAPLLYLLFNPAGQVVDGNKYSRCLIRNDLEALRVEDIFLAFAEPVDIAFLRTHPEKAEMLSIATSAGPPETLLCHFIPAEENTLVLGSIDGNETRRLRNEMLVLNNELNGLTRELQKRNHQLAELNKLKNQFLGMASHDLRSPVSAVLNYSEILIDETGYALSPKHLGFLKIIHSSTDLMRRLIDNFLSISLIESGRFQLNIEQVDIRRPVERSMAVQQIIAGKRRIAIRLKSSDENSLLQIDEYKIEQVLNNLISNAIEHSQPDSEVTVMISATDEEVLVKVTDSGPGIAEEEKEKIFSPYEKGRFRKAAGSRSTGLGLAISKKIIEAHRGKIWVENRPGRGAQFCFILPIDGVSHEETL